MPRIINSPLMPSAMTMFCQTTTRVLAAMENISGRREGESSRMTASATSMAASEPRPPIATPTPEGEYGGVVDAVAHKEHGLPGAERFQRGGLAFGEQPGAVFVEMQFLGDDGGAFGAIACQHDQPFDALPAQGLDGRGGFGPQHVRYLNGSEIGIVHGDVDDAALTGGKRGDADARILKQERIADEERPPLVPGGEALAGDFLGFHRF